MDIINVNTIFLVKEPYFKLTADGKYGLRMDHLSDVVHLNNDDARIPEVWRSHSTKAEHTAESLKIKGNAAVGKCKYWNAINE